MYRNNRRSFDLKSSAKAMKNGKATDVYLVHDVNVALIAGITASTYNHAM
jgi:hypothetical protein